MFTGHDFIKLCNDKWVFDFTEYRGYRVELDRHGRVVSRKCVFDIIDNGDRVIAIRRDKVPVGVIREALSYVNLYKSSIGEKPYELSTSYFGEELIHQ